jgi:peptidoglycan lytic transglycosylase G
MSVARRLFRTLIVLIVLTVLALVGGFLWFNAPGPAATSGDATVIILDRGMGGYAIAERLKSEAIIPSAGFFAVWVRLSGNGGKLRAGEYSIPTHASMAEVVQILAHGKPILHHLTIPEGLTTRQALRVIDSNAVLIGADPDPPPPEGSLLPETYSFPRGTTRAALIAQMTAAHDQLVETLWEKRAPNLPFDTEEQAVILASIVEKETARPSERGRIAAVFINRLRRGMMLQSDPTVIYGLTGGEPLGRGIKESELEQKTPYNTYIISGLPPTPIDNPGRASLQAVLNPPSTNELYFVADGSGGHVFSETLAQHEANVRKWRKYEKKFLAPDPAPAPAKPPVPKLRRLP